MIFVFVISFLILWFFVPVFRICIKNLHKVFYYFFLDTIDFFKNQRWKYGKGLFGIDIFVGMFGTGKTLSMVHRARMIYRIYGDKVRILSNIDLVDIPYIPLINFNQIVQLQEDNDNFNLTLVLIDEIEHVLSHRNYANFPLAMLATITQSRKIKPPVYILCTAQRFFMVDKLFRSLCTNVIDCSKSWRFAKNIVYDAWDLETKSSFGSINAKSVHYWFVSDHDYNSYNTLDLVSGSSADDFISNDEALIRKGAEYMEKQTILNHSHKRSLFKVRRSKQKRS